MELMAQIVIDGFNTANPNLNPMIGIRSMAIVQ